jgi:hypothetical protein
MTRSERGRVALGSSRPEIVWKAACTSLVPVGVGLARDLGLSLASRVFLGSFLFEVDPRDPGT